MEAGTTAAGAARAGAARAGIREDVVAMEAGAAAKAAESTDRTE